MNGTKKYINKLKCFFQRPSNLDTFKYEIHKDFNIVDTTKPKK